MPRRTGACRSSQTLALGMNPASSAPLRRLPSQALDASSNARCCISPRVAFVLRGGLHVARLPSPSPQPLRPAYFLPTRHQPSRVAQALHPSGSRTSETATQGCKVRWVVGAPRRRAAPGAQRHEALCCPATWAPSERIRTLRPACGQRKVAINATSPRQVSRTERPRSKPASAEG